MVLDRNGSLVLISALVFGIGLGCSSKKNEDDTVGTGGASAYCATPGSCGADSGTTGGTGGGGTSAFDPNTYCNGISKRRLVRRRRSKPMCEPSTCCWFSTSQAA